MLEYGVTLLLSWVTDAVAGVFGPACGLFGLMFMSLNPSWDLGALF